MKRYWQLITVVSVIVLTIGTFYIQSTFAANDLPDITVDKMRGNEDEFEPVTISGRYSFDNGMGEVVKVDAEGSTYGSEQSLFERFQNEFYDDKVNQLQEEHRSFMRGKGGSDKSYLETADTLAYANVNNQTVPGQSQAEFDIAVLDKEDDDTMSFTVPVPNRAKYAQVFVEDVQMTDDELYVMTRHYPRGGGEEAAHLYRFDILNQDIIDDDTMISGDRRENERTYFNMVTSSDETAAQDDIVFKKVTRMRGSEDAQGTLSERSAQEKVDEYIVYNPETDDMTTMDLPETLADQEILGRDKTIIYFKRDQQIVAYDLETDQIAREIVMPSHTEEEETTITHIVNDKAYLLTEIEEAPQRLMVLDLTSGDTMFEGRIKFDQPIDANASLDLYGLSVK